MRKIRLVVLGTASFIAISGLGAATLMTTMLGISQGNEQANAGASGACAATVNAPSGAAQLDQEQLANAHTIVQVGASSGVPQRGWVIAVATALQESTLRNLHYGDRDSVGLFQQRPSSGWGTVAQLTDPPTAARKFYDALVKVSGWQSMPLTLAAQTVQRSAFPRAYAKWEDLAQTLVSQMTGQPRANAATAIQVDQVSCGQVVGATLPGGSVGTMLQIALAQKGKPYVWGGIGPDYYDCSGLVVYSWRKAGFRLTVRTSEQMYGVSDRVNAGSEQPGDLLFGDFGSGGPGHVMVVITPGTAVEAPHTGDVVKVVSYDASAWVIGRLNARAFINGTIPG